jgi:hypothetical protein
MNKPKLLLLFPVLTLVAALLVFQPSVNAQQPTSSDPSAQQQPDPAGPSTSMSQTSDAQTFTGKIAKSGSKLVLKDSATKTTYMLDDQDKAKQFEGQMVKVTGRLDAQTNMIRVAAIEPGS